jgi:hypothetical protein
MEVGFQGLSGSPGVDADPGARGMDAWLPTGGMGYMPCPCMQWLGHLRSWHPVSDGVRGWQGRTWRIGPLLNPTGGREAACVRSDLQVRLGGVSACEQGKGG